MIEKDIDSTIIGRNYLSLGLGLKLLRKNQKVLIVDDHRVVYGYFNIGMMTLIEEIFLNLWGEKNEIPPFENIQKYFENQPITISIQSKQLHLGEKPSQNLKEIARKFPEFRLLEEPYIAKIINNSEEAEKFNQAFFESCLQFAGSFFENPNIKQKNIQDQLKPIVSKIYLHFVKIFEQAYASLSPESLNIQTLVFTTKALLQQKFIDTYKEETSYDIHFFLNLLSPYNYLNHEQLIQDLSENYLAQGGLYKKTWIRDWLFHKDKPWCLELADYEGIIRPKNLFF